MNVRVGLLLVVAVVALGAAAWALSRPEPPEARLVTVASGSVEALVANTRGGTLNACRRAKLAPAIGGTIATLAVSEGSSVKPGDRLLTLWSDDLAAQVTLAESEARAAASTAEQSCLLAEMARRDTQRLERLRDRELVSEERLDQAATEAASRDAACAASRAGAEVARNRVTVARSSLERTVVIAPFAGIVAEVNGEIGEFLTPSPPGIPTPPAIDLIDVGCLYVSAPIDEVDAPAIRPGMLAHVSLDAFPDLRFPGVVRRVAPYVRDLEKQARTVEVEVALLGDPAVDLLPGYTADVEVVTAHRDDVPRIPAEALLEGDRVLRFDPDSGRVTLREVTIGLRNWQVAEVTGGLALGDRVVLAPGRDGVVDGARVTPRDAAGATR